MTPFPEAEDMTVKRLYVALKRSDMQLLQMGAHKLHEKFYTGYKFELLDDLRQILSYVEEQQIPSDIKELLTTTINNILSGKEPEIPDVIEEKEIEQKELPLNFEEKNNTIQSQIGPSVEEKKEETPVKETLQTENTDIKEDNSFIQDEANEKKETDVNPVIFTPKEYITETVCNNEPVFNEEKTEEPCLKEEPKLIIKKESSLKDVMVFYDDKAPLGDFEKNKLYRNSIESNKIEPDLSALISDIKNSYDVQTDEIAEILKMLNTIKGKVNFITTSKSENIIKAFVENNINFEIPLIQKEEEYKKSMTLIPLFGLTNLFWCPKCGKKEYITNFDNKVLNIQCRQCLSVMHPDIYETNNLNSNSSPYFWIKAISLMKQSSVWVLINPPLDSTKALIVGLIKTGFEVARPEKVYILSKETTKKEYFKQSFREINPDCQIISDFTSSMELCEEFINNEMTAPLQLSV